MRHLINQIDSSDWNEVASRTDLCRLNIGYIAVEEALSLSFFDYFEDGLGRAKGLFLECDGCCFFLREVLQHKGDVGDGMSVHMRSYEPNPRKLLKVLSEVLGLDKSSYLWVRDSLSEPQWQVCKIIGDQKITIHTFHEQSDAQFMVKKNEKNTSDHYEIVFIEK